MVPVKKPPPGSLSVNTVGTPTTSGAAAVGSTPNIFAAATATPKSMINTTGELKHIGFGPMTVWCFIKLRLASHFSAQKRQTTEGSQSERRAVGERP